MVTTTFREAAERYLEWAKVNRTDAFWRSRERLLQHAIPIIGHRSMQDIVQNEDLIDSAKYLSPDLEKEGLKVLNAVSAVIGWFMEQ